MDTLPIRTSLVQKVVWLAVLGFLVVMLAGPLLSLLFFAAVGFLAWTLFRVVWQGRHCAWRRGQAIGILLSRRLDQGLRWSCTWLRKGCRWVNDIAWPTAQAASERLWTDGRRVGGSLVAALAVACRRFVAVLSPAARCTLEKIRSEAGFVGRVFLETISGAAVGMLLGLAAVPAGHDPQISLIAGAIIGTLLGGLVGMRRSAALPAS